MKAEIDVRAFEYAVGSTSDGWVFERFGLAFLAAVLGYEFLPAGGVKDRGIDGLEHVHERRGFSQSVYQLSTEKDSGTKIRRSLEKLEANSIKWSAFRYVTNRRVDKRDLLIDELSEQYQRSVQIYDIEWFIARIGESEKTVNAYRIHILSNLHEFAVPGRTRIVEDLGQDGRLFVFLRQQFEQSDESKSIDTVLADSLILLSLENTDPDENRFLTLDELKQAIRSIAKFDFSKIERIIEVRLAKLTIKPNRRVVYHAAAKAYCLPYETRLAIQERNLRDQELYDVFFEQTLGTLKEYLSANGVTVRKAGEIIKTVLFRIFYQQGLEFANFVVNEGSSEVLEKDLSQIVSEAIDENGVVIKNRAAVHTAVLMTVRDVVYNGSAEQKDFLRALSNSYLMMFVLNWDPKVSAFFASLASKLRVFVGASIIVPSLSEKFLDSTNRRHWNLLALANRAGVQLVITKPILNELVSHIRGVARTFYEYYAENEDLIIQDESQILLVDEILLRAYFYARRRELVFSFTDFIDNFVSPDLETVADDLLFYLDSEFGIKLMTSDSLGVEIPESERRSVMTALSQHKKSHASAETDAHTILMIYQLREKDRERSEGGVFGYRTWWLSKDVNTYRAVAEVLSDRYPTSCYIRPDFLFNYIVMSPHPSEVEQAYRRLFPTLLGVNISFHLAPEVTSYVRDRLTEFKAKSSVRARAILKRLIEKLKSDPSLQTREFVDSFMIEELGSGKWPTRKSHVTAPEAPPNG